jgi:hypothetical protein
VAANQEYRPQGYFYLVEIPTPYNGSGNLTIQLQGGAYCSSTSTSDTSGHNGQPTTYTVRNGDNVDPSQATIVDTTLFPLTVTNTTATTPSGSSSTTAYCSETTSTAGWQTLYTIPAAQVVAGARWYVQVQTPAPTVADQSASTGGSVEGQNSFSLRAYTSSTFFPCTGDHADPNFTFNCPNVDALNHLGTFVNGTGSQPTFYLASIGAQYAGRTLDVYLFDPGEGAQSIELLDPNYNPATFTFSVACQDGRTYPADGGTCSPAETAPDNGTLVGYGPFTNQTAIATGTIGPQPEPHISSASAYDDRLLRLRVTLPTDFTSAYGSKTWWVIRYTAEGTVNTVSDRTTWSASIRP